MTNPISAIATFIEGAATSFFQAITTFLLKITLFGLNTLEIVLFVLFIAFILFLFILPGKVYEYIGRFINPMKRLMKWIKG